MHKAQTHIMEYILLTLFIVIIITGLIFFLSGWQITQMRSGQVKAESEKALYLMKFFVKSPFFTDDESLFDDLKLTAFSKMGDDGCKQLVAIFGKDWFANISVVGGSGVLCNSQNGYENCDAWSLCNKEGRKAFSYTLPVTIYRVSENRNYIGMLNIGVYYEEGAN